MVKKAVAGLRRLGKKRLLKKLVWKAATTVGLHGLFVWRFEDHWVLLERKRMPLVGLGKGFDGKTIAHISDLHLSPIVRTRYLMRFVDAINELRPDFVAITGDLVTGRWRACRKVADVIGRFRPKIATLACLGNHDYGVWHPELGEGRPGLAEYLARRLRELGVRVMNNHSHAFHSGGSVLQFVGVEDFWTPHYDPQEAFLKVDRTRPVVALVHNPDAAPELAALGANWVLAGHTHGKDTRRQPFRRLAVPSANAHFVAGQYDLGADRYLYINRGIGHSQRGLKGDRPEITLFTLCPQVQNRCA